MKFIEYRGEQEHREMLQVNENLINDINLLNEKLKQLDVEEQKFKINIESIQFSEPLIDDESHVKNGRIATYKVSNNLNSDDQFEEPETDEKIII